MEYGAIDLHLRRSQIRIVDEAEQVILDRRVDTTREAFDRVFADRERMRIVIESSTESEWVAQYLEGLGHEVIVVDPTYAAMYGSRSRRVKTDKRDVAARPRRVANRGGYRRGPSRSPAARDLRQQLRGYGSTSWRCARGRSISSVRSSARKVALGLRTSASGCSKRLDRLSVPGAAPADPRPDTGESPCFQALTRRWRRWRLRSRRAQPPRHPRSA